MAHPIISTLRRNQGYVLAAMGVVLIITWVIGPQALEFLQGDAGTQRANPVVVQWSKGRLTEGDIAQLRREHRAVLEFVQRVVKLAMDKGATPQAPGLVIGRDGQLQQIGLPLDMSEGTVVNILLFEARGKEMGVRIDQAAMKDYLINLSGHRLKEGDFLDLARQAVKDVDHVISVNGLFEALRKELVAQQARYMVGASTGNFSTGELWEYHKQLNLRYKIEAYPIEVEKLKENFKVSDAKPKELEEIFEKGTDRVSDPDMPEPGFRQPHRISFGYCQVDFLPFLEMAKKNVLESKVEETYKAGVDQGRFRKATLPGLPPVSAPTENPAPRDEKPQGEKPDGTKAGEAKPAESESPPADKPSEKSAEKPEGKQTSEPAPEEPSSGNDNCEEEPVKNSKSGEEKSDDEKPVKPPTEKTPVPPSTDQPVETPASEKPASPEKTEPKVEESRHKTLAEARDEILSELAQPEAVSARDEAVRKAMDELRDYSTRLRRFEENKQNPTGVSGVEHPGEFRPLAFAKKYNFTYANTELVDQHEVQKTDLGASAVLRGQRGSLSFPEFAYSEKANPYEPHQADSAFSDTKFIYWRISEEAEAAVTFEQAKEQVEQAWLQEKAYQAARKQAEELAAKAAKGLSLRDAIGTAAAERVVEPFPFSMYTSDGMLIFGGQAGLSRPTGIPMAGKEFMDAVFSLKPGESGVAPNQPHTYVYAVRVLAEEPSLEIRREMFLSALQRGGMSDLLFFASMQHNREFQGIFEDLEKRYSVTWMRPVNMGDERE